MQQKSNIEDNNISDDDEMTEIQVRACKKCSQTSFCITTYDNRLLCATCHRYVKGWHAIGSELSS